MEIREPRYKVGDKMNFTNHPGIFEVVEMINFNFCINDYFYKVKHMDFGEIFITNEANLEPYVEKPKTIWDLKEDDTYYLIDCDGEVMNTIWSDICIDNDCRKIGNCFLTKEEAETESERRKIETEMLRLGGRRKFKHNRDNYGMYYSNGINVALWHLTMNQGLIYFDTRKEAEDAIEHIGRDRLKKYIFGVE